MEAQNGGQEEDDDDELETMIARAMYILDMCNSVNQRLGPFSISGRSSMTNS